MVDIAFDGSDASPVNRVVTISKDASVRLWDINGASGCFRTCVVEVWRNLIVFVVGFRTVRYTLQEDPKVLSAFTASGEKPFQAVDFAPNGKVCSILSKAWSALLKRCLLVCMLLDPADVSHGARSGPCVRACQ